MNYIQIISKSYYLSYILMCMSIRNIIGHLEFTNIKCKSLDPTLIKFDYCVLKSVNRSYKYLSMRSYPMIPINNATLNFQLMRKANGYKPFLYNITVDACKFLEHPNNPVVIFMYSFFKNFSNLNHSCPYNHPFIIEKLSVSHMNNLLTKILPFPTGDYALYKYWKAYNRPMADMRFYATLKN